MKKMAKRFSEKGLAVVALLLCNLVPYVLSLVFSSEAHLRLTFGVIIYPMLILLGLFIGQQIGSKKFKGIQLILIVSAISILVPIFWGLMWVLPETVSFEVAPFFRRESDCLMFCIISWLFVWETSLFSSHIVAEEI